MIDKDSQFTQPKAWLMIVTLDPFTVSAKLPSIPLTTPQATGPYKPCLYNITALNSQLLGPFLLEMELRESSLDDSLE